MLMKFKDQIGHGRAPLGAAAVTGGSPFPARLVRLLMLENRILKRDLVALLLAALAMFLGLSLATYDPADPPSRLTFPLRDETHNLCGPIGARVALVLLEGL